MATYSSQPGSSGLDTFIRDASGQYTNYGTNTNLVFGYNESSEYQSRILIKFDLSSIPSSAKISSATLSLYMTSKISSTNKSAIVYRMLKNWVETQANWEEYATGFNWSSSGGDGSNTDTSTTTLGNRTLTTSETVGFKNWTLNTTEIKKFIDGTYTNYGFGIYCLDAASGSWEWIFSSSDNATAANRPKLVIEYTLPVGGSQTIWFS